MRVLLLVILVLSCTLGSAQQVKRTLIPLGLTRALQNVEGDPLVHLYLKGDLDDISTWVRSHRGVVKKEVKGYLSVALPASELEELESISSLQHIHFDGSQGQPLLSKSREHARVNQVHQGIGGLPDSFTGEGVIVGVIDAGIELQHPHFQYPDGSTRIIELWDQTLPVDAQRTPTYGYGQVWDSTEINDSICPHTDQATWFGHGTNTAGIAAGDGSSYPGYRGMTPSAELIVVSNDFNSLGWTSTVSDAVDYIFSRAEALGKPCVINASLGAYLGSHDAKDLAAQSIEALITETGGRVMVCAAGDSGDQDPYHLGYEASSDTSFTWFKVPSYQSPGNGNIFFEVYGDVGDMESLQFSIGADQIQPSYVFRGNTAFDSILNRLNLVHTDTLWSVSGNSLATVVTSADSLNGTYRLQVWLAAIDSVDYRYRFSTVGRGRFDVWSAQWLGMSDMVSSNLPSVSQFPDIADYVLPDLDQSIVSSWACSDKVLTVANFTNRTSYIDVDNNTVSASGTMGNIAANSSRGPARTQVLKPDLAAPGDNTLTAGAFFQLENLLAYPSTRSRVGLGGMHHRAGGTSSASPVVAGIAALMLEKCPGMDWLDVKQALLDETWDADAYTGSLPNNRWGYGKVDALDALRSSTPEVSLLYSDDEFCEGESLELSLTQGFPEMLWNTGSDQITIDVSQSGWYHAEVYNDLQCKGRSDSVYVTERPNPLVPTIEMSGSSPACPGDTVVLSTNQTYGGYAWSNGAFTRSVFATEAGSYACEVFNSFGCSSISDTVHVDFFPAMPEAIITLIEGGRLRLSLDSSLVSSVTWFQNGAELIGESQLEWSPTEMGVYSATFTDSNGCEHASNSLNVYALGRTSMVDFDLRVFPQPFSDQLNLIGVEAFQRLELHDVSGRLIRSLPIRGDKISVLTSDIAPGLYTLRLVSSEGSGLVRQVIK